MHDNSSRHFTARLYLSTSWNASFETCTRGKVTISDRRGTLFTQGTRSSRVPVLSCTRGNLDSGLRFLPSVAQAAAGAEPT